MAKIPKWVFGVIALAVVALAVIVMISVVFFAETKRTPTYEEWLRENRTRLVTEGLSEQEEVFVGLWELTGGARDRVRIVKSQDGLQFLKIGGRHSKRGTALTGPDPIVLLSDNEGVELGGGRSHVAFVEREVEFAMKRYTLKVRDDQLQLDQVTIFTDDSKRRDYFLRSSYVRVLE